MLSSTNNTQETNKTVFIGGLPGTASKSSLSSHFRIFGQISEIKLKLDRRSNLSKGYALITFKERKSYEAAIRAPEQYLFSRTISCQPFLQGEDLNRYLEDLNSRRLFVKYIPKSFDNQKFENVFKKFGEVDFGYVVKDPKTGRSRGFGYITLKRAEDAEEVQKLRCLKLKGSKKMKIFPYKRRGGVEKRKKFSKSSRCCDAEKAKAQTNQGEEEEDIRTPFEIKKIENKGGKKLIGKLLEKKSSADIDNKPEIFYEKENFNFQNLEKKKYFVKGKKKNINHNKLGISQDREIASEHNVKDFNFHDSCSKQRIQRREIWKKFVEEKKEDEYPEFLRLPFILPIPTEEI